MYLTQDFGQTWTLLQESVKSFYWTVGAVADDDDDDDSIEVHEEKDASKNVPTIYVQRIEPSGLCSILASTDLFKSFKVIAQNMKDFHLKGDFMFYSREVEFNMVSSKTQDMPGSCCS